MTELQAFYVFQRQTAKINCYCVINIWLTSELEKTLSPRNTEKKTYFAFLKFIVFIEFGMKYSAEGLKSGYMYNT